MSKILLIEDSDGCQLLVRSALQNMGELHIARDLKEARALIDKGDYQLLLIDVNLPDGNGFEFCSALLTEKAPARPRVLFLTGNGQISDKLMGYSVGADDYLVKPFEPLELKARVSAMLRNSATETRQAEEIHIGNLHLHVAAMRAEIMDGAEARLLDLTPTEFKLLYCLAKQEGHVFSRDQLLYNLSAGRTHVLDRTIDSHLCRTRKKLEGCTHNVESIYGVGYRFTKAA